MFGSEALEVGLGLTFIYLILSLACTAFTEVFSSAIKLRAGVLRDGIYNLLSQQRYGLFKKIFGRYKTPPEGNYTEGATLAEQFYRHPLIRTLFEQGHGPSYVPARTFAIVLQDLLGLDDKDVSSAGGLEKRLKSLKNGADGEAKKQAPAPKGQAPAPKGQAPVPALEPQSSSDQKQPEPLQKDTTRLTKILELLVEEARQDMVLTKEGSAMDQAGLVAEIVRLGIGDDEAQKILDKVKEQVGDAKVELAQLREKIEVWYNNAMDRVGGWYKRWTKAISFTIALIMVIAINADTIEMAGALTSNDALREALVNKAKVYTQVSATTPDSLLTRLIAENNAAPDTTAPPAQPNQVTLEDVVAQARAANLRLDTTMTQLQELGLPLGWPQDQGICIWVTVPYFCKQAPDAQTQPGSNQRIPFFPKLFGLLITTFALTLGAPFWFDMLNKIVSIRSSGKSTEEQPKAPQAPPKRPEAVAPQ